MRRHYKTRLPAANVDRCNERMATDMMFNDTPALDDGVAGHGGCDILQLFVGVDSKYTVGYPIPSKDMMPDALRDVI